MGDDKKVQPVLSPKLELSDLGREDIEITAKIVAMKKEIAELEARQKAIRMRCLSLNLSMGKAR